VFCDILCREYSTMSFISCGNLDLWHVRHWSGSDVVQSRNCPLLEHVTSTLEIRGGKVRVTMLYSARLEARGNT
jgi:hypothetical protein